jgi:hypothetical protein
MSAPVTLTSRNEAFLRNLYRRGRFERHAFCCVPPMTDHPDGDFSLSAKPVENWVPWVVENYERKLQSVETLRDDSVPFAKLGTGTYIFAAAFGCEVKRDVDFSNGFTLPRVRCAEEADRLAEPDIWKSPTLYRVFELAHAVQRRLGSEAFLGPADQQTGFDTAALVWNKTDFLRSMLDPESRAAVKRLTGKCAHLFKTFLLEFRKEFPRCSSGTCPSIWAPPEMGPWPSNDECGNFSTPLFEEFCLPELVDLAETFGGLGMHCCADAEHQFESFKRIPGFYAFNRCAGMRGRGYLPILDHLAGPDAPVHVLGLELSEEEVIGRLLSRAAEGTRFIFALLGASADDARQWLDRVRQLPNHPARICQAITKSNRKSGKSFRGETSRNWRLQCELRHHRAGVAS